MKILERDLNTFLANKFYASTFETMNDKFEANFDEIITETFVSLEKLFNIKVSDLKKRIQEITKFKDTLGIYCLSKTYLSETLWAYYADNNRGYCIEYDIYKLKDKTQNFDFAYEVDVNYSDEKPILTINDINNQIAINKMFGTKKKRWSQEEEIRLLFDNSGFKTHHHSAISAICFGCDASNELIEKFIQKFENRNISFYKMKINYQTNGFERELITKNIMKLNFDINKFNYQLVKTIDNSTVTNYYLYTEIKYNLNELKELALSFKEKYSYKNCNIYFINNIEILEVLEKYPKSDSEYVKFAESIIADFPFDCNDEIFSYPFKDWKYEELITK